jgi:signal peptidase I
VTSDIGDPAPAREPVAPSANAKKKQLPLWQETILLLVIALGLSVLIKAVFLQAFYIPSESMEPGLINNDRILVQKVTYWGGGTPERGDVVVFKDPGDWLQGTQAGPTNPIAQLMSKVGLYPSGGHLVKRVIGVEGDIIKCCDKQGRLTVNGVPLDEGDYIKVGRGLDCNGPMVTDCGKDWTAGPIPEGQIFVMGDNRANSADSSDHMCRPDETECVPGDEFIDADLVVGKVFALVWPRARMGWIRQADSFADVPDGN